VVVNGTNPTYQWQVDTGSGFTNITNNSTYSGATTATLTVSNITAGMNGYLYRVVLGGDCTTSFNSNSASLNVGAVATINSSPSNQSVCPGVNVNFSVNATNATSYQWQVNTGSGFTDITNNATYSGATTSTLTVSNVTVGMNGYQYRVLVGSCPSPLTSATATLTVSTPLSITTQPVNVTACVGDNVSFTVVVAGSALSYQWQISTNGGATFSNIVGATSATYSISNVTLAMSGTYYRVTIAGTCNNLTSTAALLTVNPLPVVTITPITSPICNSDPAFILTGIPAGGIWTGTGVTGTVAPFTFTPSTAGVGTFTLTYTASASGCSASQTTTVQVVDCSARHLLLSDKLSTIVYPVPGPGTVKIRMKTDLYKNLGVRVYDSNGKLIRTTFFNNAVYDAVLTLPLTALEDGVYHLYMYNEEKGFVSKGVSIVIQN